MFMKLSVHGYVVLAWFRWIGTARFAERVAIRLST